MSPLAWLGGLLCLLSLSLAALAATPAETATQVRNQWAEARKTYLAAIQPYADKPEHAKLVQQYTEALDMCGQSLEQYLALKLASPPTPTAKLTPVVDQLAKNLAALRSLQGKAGGNLATVLGKALSQHNQITQTALKNMR
jgi:hypothetical protein